MTTPHPQFHPEHCANCQEPKAEAWHLLCERCFNEVPKPLADELVASCKAEPNGRRHHSAIEAALQSIEVSGRPSPLSDGASHYTGRGECAGPFGEA